jgi:D-xylose transport system ATP-binding protein
LVLIQSILRNISLANLNRFSTWFKIDDIAELKESTDYAKRLTIKASNLQAMADSLSGGNQQKVVIAKWLMSQPKVLIMDDPTRGIDVGTKYEIYKIMNDLAEKGIAIIMISSDLEEVLGMSDRIMVMCENHSVCTLDTAKATQEKIMALATGTVSQPVLER